MPVTPINSLAEFQDIINSGKAVVIDFWATWCGPCRLISPIFEKLSAKFEDVEFYKVDVDEQPEISEQVGIRAMPTFMAFKDGNKIDDVTGAFPDRLEKLIITAKAAP